jgi:hypothetical protein
LAILKNDVDALKSQVPDILDRSEQLEFDCLILCLKLEK